MKIQNNRTKTATTIISAIVIGLAMLSPTTILPNVSAQQIPLSKEPESIMAIENYLPTKLSATELANVKTVAIENTQVHKLIDGKSYQFMAQDFTGNYKTELGVWYPEIHINVNNVTEISVIENPSINSVISVATFPLHRSQPTSYKSAISNLPACPVAGTCSSKAIDWYTGSQTIDGISMDIVAPSTQSATNTDVYFLLNGLEHNGNDANSCNSAYAASDYWDQVGFSYSASQPTDLIGYTDTTNSCYLQYSQSISYVSGHQYQFEIYVAANTNNWYVQETDVSGGSVNIYMYSPNYNYMATSDSETSVFLENWNTNTNWAGMFTSSITATAQIHPQGGSWTVWGAEKQADVDCNLNWHYYSYTGQVISGNLTNSNPATWSPTNMQNYPSC